MASVIKWEGAFAAAATVLSTELDALAAATRSAAGTEYDNSANLNQYGWLQLDVDFVSAPTDRGPITIYMVKAMDGSNYEDGSASVRPAGTTIIAVIDALNTTAAQKRTSVRFDLPPCKIKFLLENGTSQPFPATGSTVKLFVNNDEAQ